MDVSGSSTFALSDREEHFATYVCQLALTTTTFSHNGSITSFGDLRVPAIRSLEDPRRLECVTPQLGYESAAMLGFTGLEGRYEMPFTYVPRKDSTSPPPHSVCSLTCAHLRTASWQFAGSR